jgi:hypothetical protein
MNEARQPPPTCITSQLEAVECQQPHYNDLGGERSRGFKNLGARVSLTYNCSGVDILRIESYERAL